MTAATFAATHTQINFGNFKCLCASVRQICDNVCVCVYFSDLTCKTFSASKLQLRVKGVLSWKACACTLHHSHTDSKRVRQTTDREREGEAAPTHWQIDMHSAVVGALLLFEVRNAPPKQDTHTYAHWHIKQSCLPASLLLIICKYVHAHMYISMYVHGTYGSPDIVAIAIYTYIHIQLNAWRTHTHTCSAGHDKRHSNKIRNYSQRAAVKSCSRSQKQQQPWHITHTLTHTLAAHKYTHIRTHAYTHARLERQQVQVHYTTICASGLKVYEAL